MTKSDNTRNLPLSFLTILIFFFSMTSVSVSLAAMDPDPYGHRVALVIGNGTYQDPTLNLPNPQRDAMAMWHALEELKFEVTPAINYTQREMLAAIEEFSRKIRGDSVALFYYAGHGVGIGGQNYLVPKDAGAKELEDKVTERLVSANAVLKEMRRNRLNILILDACRNDPGRGVSLAIEGFSKMTGGVGEAVIAYSTAEGERALDGPPGKNSYYTKHWLAQMQVPGQELADVLRKIKAGTQADTDNKQIPWQEWSVTGRFYFLPLEEDPSLPKEDLLPPKLPFWQTPLGMLAIIIAIAAFAGILAFVIARGKKARRNETAPSPAPTPTPPVNADSGTAPTPVPTPNVDADEETATLRAMATAGRFDGILAKILSDEQAYTSSATLPATAVDVLVGGEQYPQAIQGVTFALKRFPDSLRLRQLHGLALRRNGQLNDAIYQLNLLYEQGNRDAETLGMLAATWADMWERRQENSDAPGARARDALEKSRNLYEEAFTAFPADIYTGINAASKSALLGEREKAVAYAGKVLARLEKMKKGRGGKLSPDYWERATEAEARLLEGDWAQARDLYHVARVDFQDETGSIRSTAAQLQRLLGILEVPDDIKAELAREFNIRL
uniref:Caspase domain-containing protein n=1 Tax=Candidatus Kentrum sp. FW TaxID=2126338 RepID=A0A450TN22_9GAMM|nr:MAG: Caspase domain-containing protein [Candidatus Kentron sp. FW]